MMRVFTLVFVRETAFVHGLIAVTALFTMAVGLLVLSLVGSGGEFRRHATRWRRSIAFAACFLREVVAASIRLICFLVAPDRRMRSGIGCVPLNLRSE